MFINVSMRSTQISITFLLFLILYIQIPTLALGNPDIEMISFETAPSAAPGGAFYVEYTLTNNGNYTSGPLKLTYYLSTEKTLSSKAIIIGQYTIRSVRPGEVTTAHSIESIPSTVPPATYYPIIRIIPAQPTFKDINLENNILITSQIEVTSQENLSREWINKKASEILFVKTNEERERRNRAPLTYSYTLESIAQGHADDMAKRDYFDHISPEGKSPHDRAVEQGYPHERIREDGSIIYGIGENIVRFPTGDRVYVSGFAYIDPADPIQLANVAITSFLNSPSHKKTLLSEIYHEIGIAATMGQDEYYYLTQNFG
jgi:uncharacterized protein YkwD